MNQQKSSALLMQSERVPEEEQKYDTVEIEPSDRSGPIIGQPSTTTERRSLNSAPTQSALSNPPHIRVQPHQVLNENKRLNESSFLQDHDLHRTITQKEVRAIIDNFKYCQDRYVTQAADWQRKLDTVRDKVEEKQRLNRRYFAEREDLMLDIEREKLRVEQIDQDKQKLSSWISYIKPKEEEEKALDISVREDEIIESQDRKQRLFFLLEKATIPEEII